METKNYNLFVGMVAVLVLLNCALLGIYWFKRSDRHPAGLQPLKPNEYLIKELGMTPEEVKSYDSLRRQHFAFSSRINQESRQLHENFFNNIKTPKLDTAKAFAIERRLGMLQLMLDTATLNHFRKVRALLTDEQKSKFDQVIQNALRMMGQQHPPQRRGDGPPNDMPPPPNGGPGPEQGPPPGATGN